MTNDDHDLEREVNAAVRTARKRAFEMPPFDGSDGSVWVQARAMRDLPRLGCRVAVTRDTGHVRGKIFDSPDLERCVHFMICDGAIVKGFPGPLKHPDPRVEPTFVRFLFGPLELARTWLDVVKEEGGRVIRHWRLFCDREWNGIDVRDVGAAELQALGWTRYAP